MGAGTCLFISTSDPSSLTHERPTPRPSIYPQQDDDHHFVSKYANLEEVVGKVMEVAQDQNGCRFLQKKFDEGGPASISLVFQVGAGGARLDTRHDCGRA